MPVKILVIDDEPSVERLIRQRMRKKIREGHYTFVFVRNGEEALELIQKDPDIDLTLSDIRMPKMDGLTFISRLKELGAHQKTIIVSAFGDWGNIRKAMNLGAFDFIMKPIDFEDLEKTIDKTIKELKVARQAERAGQLAERNKKLRELDEFKSKIFTNISHEFRTPLTIINGMASQIVEEPERWASKGGRMILRNGQNLLDLVNRILELGQLESGEMKLEPIQADILPYIHYIFESFETFADRRDVKMELHQQVDQLVMDYDPEKMLRILSNLLDNAIKFTPAKGKVILTVANVKEQLQVKVADTGLGISEDQLEKIFDRFFQAEGQNKAGGTGSGIGLSLVKELVRLMEGTITVSSELNKGTCFTFSIPVTHHAEIKPTGHFDPATEITDHRQEQEFRLDINNKSEDLPRLLIVEDNVDVAKYITSILDMHYHLDFATDGRQGVEKALELIPDIIVSDVMMPGKDGFELCDILKKDGRTSHIPIVLLTAKADAESKISGLQKGADAYLGKPFNKRELLVRLEKLLELRKKLQERFRELDPEQAAQSTDTTSEDAFILRMQEVIHNNLDDEDFGIQELCREIGVSRTQLHRKIKALTGLSTSIYVRSLRLKKARELLDSSDLNISQIAFEVGFRDPKYFSRTFAEAYGVSPNQYRK